MSQPTEPFKPAACRHPIRAMLAAFGFTALLAGCTTAPSDRPFDVGNMAYPQPLPEGNLNTTAVSGRLPRDTGNMAYPESVPAGVVGRAGQSRQAFDTGNMAYPNPLPAGNGPNTRVR